MKSKNSVFQDLYQALVTWAEDVNQQKKSAVDLTKAALANIDRLNPTLNAFCSYDIPARPIQRCLVI